MLTVYAAAELEAPELAPGKRDGKIMHKKVNMSQEIL